MKPAVVLAFVVSAFALLAFPVALFLTITAWPLRFSTARDIDGAIGFAGMLLYPALWAVCLVFARRNLTNGGKLALGFAAAPYAWFALACCFGFSAIRG